MFDAWSANCGSVWSLEAAQLSSVHVPADYMMHSEVEILSSPHNAAAYHNWGYVDA
jgi:hypothetical protein